MKLEEIVDVRGEYDTTLELLKQMGVIWGWGGILTTEI